MALLSRSTTPYCRHDINIQHKSQNHHANILTSKSCNSMILEHNGLKIQQRQRWLSFSGTNRQTCLDENSKRGRRRKLFVVAASPPTEDVAVMREPLTKQDLVAYLASGCKPKEKWRIGTEHEKFGFEQKTLRPMNYEQISELFQGLAERFAWDKVIEGDRIIGLKQDNQSISLEPGGQFELSGAPLETLHQTCAEVNSHLYQVKAVAEEMGLGFLGIGFHPKWEIKDIPIMPKGRYEIMRNYMPKVGSLGLDMMFRTCTVQVNLDFSSEIDMVRKFRAGLALQPIATALFANSPFKEGKPNGFLSYRSHIWTDTDNNRSGMLPFVFDDSFGFESYVDYALDVPMYFVYRKKKYIDCSGMSFRDFMAGKLPPIPGELPTLNDWENHLTTIFPEVRLKRYLEMRGADGGPWRRLCALPALWVGLLYDETSLQTVLELTKDWTKEERQMLRNKVPKMGLKTPFRDGLLKHVAEDILQLAREGLQRRGFKESGFLNEVAEVVRTGVTPAERLLDLYQGKWGNSVDPVFEELLY
uniref:glutamate--cysteine ligase n=2 Tax=Wollemia nobilis TaxID=56998 RepID=A0A0C9S817_9CONI